MYVDGKFEIVILKFHIKFYTFANEWLNFVRLFSSFFKLFLVLRPIFNSAINSKTFLELN